MCTRSIQTQRHIFTYGSLMFPSVWESVVAGRYRSEAATLADHGRFRVIGETYPGMVVKSGMHVTGLAYFDVSTDDIDTLDRFEGSYYRRCEVSVRFDSGEIVLADAYLFTAADRLMEITWEPECFALEGFMTTYCIGDKSA
jgi:gamma-glutamylcyclotransferase (GGCT)/AIG2-like uncharacterized protein YtfP